MQSLVLMVIGFLTFTTAFAQDFESLKFETTEDTQKKIIQPFGDLHIDVLIGRDQNKNKQTDFRIGAALGVSVFEQMEIGAGVDALIFDNYRNLAPHLHLAYSPFYKIASPFIEANLGYSFVMESNYANQYYENLEQKGSLYLSTGLGVRVFSKAQSYISVSGGFTSLNNTTKWKYSWADYEEQVKETYKRWYIRFAFGF